MENQTTPETLDEDAMASRLSQAQNLCDNGENGCDFDAKGICMEKGIEVVSGNAEESQIGGVKNADLPVPMAGSEVNEIDEIIVEGVMKEGCSPSELNELDPARKIEHSGDGISLFVEVFGPPNELIQSDEAVLGKHVLRGTSYNHVYEGNGALLSDNGENPSANVSVIHDPMFGVTQNGTEDGEAEGGDEAQEEAFCNQECKFSVGDLVWVKTKTQSWWPGVILDPLYEPKDTLKSDQRACLLVKYFGNGSYVWCSPFQLKPFIENFEQMFAQGNSTTFVGAVKKAVNEFGSRVKLQMTCSCILKENQTVFTASLDGNCGNKDLLHRIDGVSVTQFEPTNFLAIVKFLAQDGSVPGMLEFAAIQNRLSAFYRAIGHHQLPMHQLRGTTDVKDGDEDGLKSGVPLETVLEKKVEDMGIEKCSSGFHEEEKVQNGSGEVADIDSCKLSSPTTTESKVSDGGSGGKSGKAYESRERRRSKYLSPPYTTNLSFGGKNSPVSEEKETGGGKVVSHAGQSVASPPIVKSSGKKLQKKKSMKAISDHNASAKMLSELRFAALDCLHSDKSRKFDQVERFFSGFRRSAFHDKSNYEMHILQTLPEGEVPMGKARGMEEESTESWGSKPFADNGGSVPVGKDTQERSEALPSITPKRRRKKELATVGSNTKPAPGFSDVNGIPANGSFIINFQETGCLAPEGMSVPKKRKKKAAINVEVQLAKVASCLPDLNGKCTTPSSLVEDSQATELHKRENMDGAASVHSMTKSIGALADGNGNGNGANVGSLLVDVQVLGPCDSTQNIAELNKDEGTKGAAASVCLNSKSELTANQPDTKGNNTQMSSYIKDLMGLLSPSDKPQPKKRKRKEKTNISFPIPDLNGNAAEPSSMGANLPAGEGKPPRKRRRRRNKSDVGMIPNVNVNYNKVLTYGEALGTALILKFAEGFPVPSKESLVAMFCGFGEIKESETKALSDSVSAHVVFVNSKDAGNALKSLEKSSPFGPALVNYRLHHLSSAAPTGLKMPVNSQTKGGFKVPPNPFVGLKPQPGEAPDLCVIRKNLEMMTSMLEKAGDDLSPETRAKLESEVKGLLKKVSTMTGSSSSSSPPQFNM